MVLVYGVLVMLNEGPPIGGIAHTIPIDEAAGNFHELMCTYRDNVQDSSSMHMLRHILSLWLHKVSLHA